MWLARDAYTNKRSIYCRSRSTQKLLVLAASVCVYMPLNVVHMHFMKGWTKRRKCQSGAVAQSPRIFKFNALEIKPNETMCCARVSSSPSMCASINLLPLCFTRERFTVLQVCLFQCLCAAMFVEYIFSIPYVDCGCDTPHLACY